MTKIVDFVLYDEAVGLDITGPLEVFNAANILLAKYQQEEVAYATRFLSLEPGKVKLNSGLCLYAEYSLARSKGADMLLIPGSSDIEPILQRQEFLSQVVDAAGSARQIVSVCTGAFILAACGLLENKRATTHWSMTEQLAWQYPTVRVEPDAIYVRDGTVATSAGVTAGIDLALALVEEDHGAALAVEIARWLVLYLRRSGGQAQFSAPLKLQQRAGNRFSRLHGWLTHNLGESLNVESLADKVGMSPRNFSRVFAQETGVTPGKYLELLRLEKARELLESGQKAINQIAMQSGFGREERMRRAFLRELGVTPGLYQSHFNKATSPESVKQSHFSK